MDRSGPGMMPVFMMEGRPRFWDVAQHRPGDSSAPCLRVYIRPVISSLTEHVLTPTRAAASKNNRHQM